MATTPAVQNQVPLPPPQGPKTPQPTDASKKGLKNTAGERVSVRGPPKPQGTHTHLLPMIHSDEFISLGTTNEAPTTTPSVGNKRNRGDTTVGEKTPTNTLLLMKQGTETKKSGSDLLNELRVKNERKALQKEEESKPLVVPVPKAGFPKIHRLFPTSTVDNLCPETLEAWMNEGRHGLLAVVHLLNAWMPGHAKVIVKLIKAVVMSTSGIKVLFVAPAVPATPPNPTEETAPPTCLQL
ncbi:hypothetical protein HWV62_20446 [Athelia sp. TMB]|nr:hypothetical protein HWV62_20446 [Athelia sp. TMB]